MFTDMVGFTRIAQQDEDLGLKLREEQQRLIRSHLAEFGGREIKTLGDGFLIEFPSAVESVRCAVRIQSDVARRNAERGPGEAFELRIGVHVGDIVGEGNDVVGDAVNVASRIEGAAGAGEVWISAQAADQVRNKLSFHLEALPPMELKNLGSPLTLYKVIDSAPHPSTASRPGGFAEGIRLAVLPFASVSPDPQDDYFADGLTDELIGVVARTPGLSVISRTSAMRYKEAAKPVGEIGRELRVGTILEGSVRKAGNRVRISARLVDVQRDRQLWSERFDRELSDVFAIQEEIAEEVARALQLRLLPTPPVGATVHAARSTEAYTLYLKGRYFWNKGTHESLLKALEQFQQAVELEPTYGPAYAGIADSYLLLGRRGDDVPQIAYPKAVDNALKALRLDASLAEPHAALGSIRQEYEWKWADSEAEFIRALELNPSYSTAHSWYALFLGHVGRFTEALGESARAQELDPLSHRIHASAAEEFIFARQYDDAIRAAERALELEPSFGSAHGYIGQALVGQGLTDRAIHEFEEAGRLLGAQALMGRLGHALALSGRTTEALHLAEQLKEGFATATPGNPFLSPTPYASLDIGLVYLGLGQVTTALEWFERAREDRVPEVVHFKCEPIYDPLQKEPRFRALLESVGLGERESASSGTPEGKRI
jgi:adenylate cyclase